MSELEWEFYKHQSYHAHFAAYCKYHIHFKTMTEFQLRSSKNRHAKFSSCILLLVTRIKFMCETQYCHGSVVMYDSYLLKDVHSVLVNFPREYAQESMMLYI